MSDHAELAPSAAARWMSCTASISFCRGVEQEDSDYAIEGTLAHEKLELWLSLGVPPTDGLLYEHLERAFSYAVSLERLGYSVSFERRLQYNERLWGTADILGTKGKDKLAIGDYKHGYRVVEAVGNAQMATYGICAAKESGFTYTNVEFAVIQPRISHVDGPVRIWRPESNGSVPFLEWHRLKVEAAISEVYGPSPKFKAGRHCKFCPREGDCKTFSNYVAKLVTGSELFEFFNDGEDLL